MMRLSNPVFLSTDQTELTVSMVLTIRTFNNCGQIAWILILNRVLGGVTIFLTAGSS